MRVSILRHSCGLSNLVQLLSNLKHVKQKCPFYWKMRGGDIYYGNLYYFTAFGFRLVIDTTIKKDLWVK